MLEVIALILALLVPAEPDLILRGGGVVDGSGNPWFVADVAVDDGVIVEIAHKINRHAKREVDATGMIVAPGFIDLHTHARRRIFQDPLAESYLRQGVTTLFEGPDGSSPFPIGEFLREADEANLAPNLGTFIGHGSVRTEVMGSVDRAPTSEEMDEMRRLVRQGMREGAFGLSTGLFYVPGSFATTEEVIDLARVAGEMGGIHTSHMRNESAEVVKSVAETIRIGEEGGLPTQVTHHKVMGRVHAGLSKESLRLIDAARKRGVDVSSDLYPYTASSTGLHSGLFPSWANEGGREKMLERLADSATRNDIREIVVEKIRFERGGGDPSNIQIAATKADPEVVGKNLKQIMIDRGIEPTIENAADLALELIERSWVSAIFHAISEPDLENILTHHATMIASDGEVAIPGEGSPHPRCCGTYPRVLALYVREKGLLTLEDAIRKMTSFPAQRVGLSDRGLLRPGLRADIVVFDAEEIQDHATFENPFLYATGIRLVVINGQVVVENDELTGARPGAVLRGPAASVAPPGL